MTLCSFAKSWLKYYRDNAELKNSTPRKNWEGISMREGDGNAFLGEELWRGVRNHKTAPPPEELGRDFQEGSGWKCLPGRGVMEGGAEL